MCVLMTAQLKLRQIQATNFATEGRMRTLRDDRMNSGDGQHCPGCIDRCEGRTVRQSIVPRMPITRCQFGDDARRC
jgi:hypothetical protein